MATERPQTLGDLKASGFRMETVKDEMRRNLVAKIRKQEPLFPDILGYEETVVPQIQNAVLSKHDILFLGLRGQAKTRMLRQLVHLLDDAMPIVEGSEVNDHPYAPISRESRDRIATMGDATPIAWVGREHRYNEKLATPDVTIADLIGEVDMIKHAEGRHLSSELTMHFGLIPRTNRGIFCINELPDLSPKIQVGLFNVLEERDIQIRGYPVRMNLDMALVFSANPEDYTNRGRIVTPLKDRDRLHDPHPLPAHARPGHQHQRPERLARARRRQPGRSVLCERGCRGNLAPGSYIVACEPAIRRVGADVDREPGKRCLQRRASRVAQQRTWIIPRVSDLAHLAPSARGKLELTMTEDDGQEDKLVERIVAEAVKNVFSRPFRRQGLSAGRRIFRGWQGGRGRRHSLRPRRVGPDREGPCPPQEGR